MAVENMYGKSAVDATRKNALPPYLDKVFESGVGGGSEVFIIDATLELINWTNSTNSLAVEMEISDDAQVMVFSQEENQTEYSVAEITCTAGAYDSVTGFTIFSFSCTSTPTIDLKIYMLIISSKSVDLRIVQQLVEEASVDAESAAGSEVNALAYAERAEAAAELVESKASRYTFTGTLTTAWVGNSAPYTQEVSITGILATDMPHISPIYSDTLATELLEKEAWSLLGKAISGANNITFSCFEDKPTQEVNFQVEVLR